MSKLEYHKLIPWNYTSQDGIRHESLISFHEADGTFSTVTCNKEDCNMSTVVACCSISSSSVSAIACSNDGQRVAVGYKDGSTRIYLFTAEQLLVSSSSYHPFFTSSSIEDDLLEYTAGPRFQSCVRALAFDPRSSSDNGYFLAAASEDYDCGVCVVDLSNTMSERYLVESSSSFGGVRSLAYTSTVENDTVLLAALGMDGKLTIYTCMGLDQPDLYWDVLSREVLPIVSTNDIGDSLRTTKDALWAVEPIWSADGLVLVIPGSTDVQLRLRGDVTKKYCIYSNIKEGHLLGDIVACAVKDSDLVSVGRDGTTCVWKLHTDIVTKLIQDPSLLEETLGRFHKSWTTNEAPTSVVFTKDYSTNEEYICIQYANGNCQLHSKSSAMAGESKTKQATQSQTKAPVSLEEEEEDKDEESIQFDTQPPPTVKKTNIFVDNEAKEEEDEDDFDDISQPDAHDETTTVGYNEEFQDDLEEAEFIETNTTNYVHNSKLPKPQEAFAPSSTPLHDDALDARRILCWNHVGVVTSRLDTGRGGRIVDVNFADVLTSGFKTFSDSYGFEIGTLSDEGGIFATLPEEDNGSRIYYFRFETIGLQNKKDWTMILPDGEGALGCACGDGWAAVVTGRRFLRLFGSGGVQRSITCLKGDPVTMAGRGRLLAVVYHESSPLPDMTQQLEYMLLDGMDGTVICSGSLTAVGCGQKLTWIGFSNDFTLTVMDSGGMLSMLNKSAGWQWTPMLDTLGKKKSEDDSFWPVSVLDGKLLCVPLKGGHEHPDATRRPITTALDLRMPMANSGLKKSIQLEETSARASVALMQQKFVHELQLKDGADPMDLEEQYARSCAQVDKVTLRLFHESLQANLYERALDFVARLHLEKSFEIALTVSEQFRSRTLSDRIEMIKVARFAFFDDDEFIPEQNEHASNQYADTEQSFPEEYHSSLRRISPDTRSASQLSGNKRKVDENEFDDESQQSSPSKVCPTPVTLNPFAKRQVFSPTKNVNKSKSALVGSVSSPKPKLSRNSTFTFKSKEETRTKKIFL